MPELSRFYGIVVRIFVEGGSRHVPHFHAQYGAFTVSYGIDPIRLLAGDMPVRQRRLLEAWAELHQAELVLNWERIQRGERRMPIDPLQ